MKELYLDQPIDFGRFRGIYPLDILKGGQSSVNEFMQYLNWLDANTDYCISIDLEKATQKAVNKFKKDKSGCRIML